MSVDFQVNETQKAGPYPTTLPPIPPLENGDHLTKDEFERRYNAMPKYIKAELIEGKVYMSSPVRCKSHGEPDNRMSIWVGTYGVFTPGVIAANNTTVHLDEINEPQPDVLLIIKEHSGGQTIINADDYLEGAPELAVEVAASSATYDLREKKEAYRRNGVREYIVWPVYDLQLLWFRLEAGEYIQLAPDEDGVIRSRTFPGLWLDVEALLKDDMAKVLATLQQGLASPEHADFVKQLSEERQ
ncbi:MAG TPA: Uma2 family endonuclease [Blastocatellia bacterium]|nr:Uma2 family endonuclease [Blastocatellia bacterium]